MVGNLSADPNRLNSLKALGAAGAVGGGDANPDAEDAVVAGLPSPTAPKRKPGRVELSCRTLSRSGEEEEEDDALGSSQIDLRSCK